MKYKISKILLLIILNTLIFEAKVFAQESTAAEKHALKAEAQTPEIKQDLDSPDGVSIELLPNGGFRVFAKGTGTYDLNEADEIRQGTKDAELRAKAALSKFLSEKIKSKDSVLNISQKVKKLSSGGANGSPSVDVSKTDVQTRVEEISSKSEAILQGIITLETIKTPLGQGGTISVILGVSSKSLALSSQLGRALNSAQSRSGYSDPASSGKLGGASDGNNTSEVKKAKTDL